jgi:hypothetical protein
MSGWACGAGLGRIHRLRFALAGPIWLPWVAPTCQPEPTLRTNRERLGPLSTHLIHSVGKEISTPVVTPLRRPILRHCVPARYIQNKDASLEKGQRRDHPWLRFSLTAALFCRRRTYCVALGLLRSSFLGLPPVADCDRTPTSTWPYLGCPRYPIFPRSAESRTFSAGQLI